MPAPSMLSLLAAAGAAAAWSPSSLTSLAGWWDSDDASTFTYSSGVVVSQWNDKSGNARHFTQSTVANQPSRNGTQNGRTTVAFDGSNDYMDTGSFTVSQPFTVLFVAKGRTGNHGLLGSVGGSLQMFDDTANFKMEANGTSATAFARTTSWCSLIFVFNGSSSIAYKDGTASSTLTVGTTGTTTGLRTGERGLAAGWYFGAEIAEVVVMGAAISASERTEWQSYVVSKWATP